MLDDIGDAAMSANMVMMMRADVDGAIWLVDDADEGRFYETLAHKQSRVIPAFGRAINVLDCLMERGAHGVVAMARGDADIAGDARPIFRPDVRDVATVLLKSRGADRVLGEIGGATWLTACGREIGPIVPRAVRVARALQRILGTVVIGDDDVRNFVEWATLGISADALARVAQGSNAADISVLLDEDSDFASALIECDGVNAVRVLAAATVYYRPRGIAAHRGITSAELVSLLNVGFDPEEIEKDGVYWRLKHWQWRNGKYALFRVWRKLDPFGILLDHSYFQTDVAHLAESGSSFAAIQLDLDNFKAVNDALGHIEGDDAIRLAEKILLRTIDGRGEAYRRGGDELTALLIGYTNQDAKAVAERLRMEIEAQFAIWSRERNHSPSPTASIGVFHTAGECEANDILESLETAQLEAKRAGKNRVCMRSQ